MRHPDVTFKSMFSSTHVTADGVHFCDGIEGVYMYVT